jgi:hypothetical protein
MKIAGMVPVSLKPWGIPSAVVTSGTSINQNQNATRAW